MSKTEKAVVRAAMEASKYRLKPGWRHVIQMKYYDALWKSCARHAASKEKRK